MVLEVQVLAPDWEAQALDLAPAPVLAPTQALARPALLETGDQALDLRPRPLLGLEGRKVKLAKNDIFDRQHVGSWSGRRGSGRGSRGRGRRFGQQDQACFQTQQVSPPPSFTILHISTFAGTGQTNTSHSPNQRKALEAICLGAAKSLMVIRPLATGRAGAPTLPGVLASGSQRSRVFRRKCSDSVSELDSWVERLSGWPARWRATASITSTRSFAFLVRNLPPAPTS